jgi:ribosomal protein S18 acetylase RimI-like enzyme
MNQVKNEILVRAANLKDIDFIINANASMALEIEGLTLDLDLLEAGVRAVFENSSRGSYLVAELDGVICGCLLITIEWSDWRNNEIAWIQSLYVVESHRGKGAFKKMFVYLESLVEAGVYAGIRLYVDITNERGIEVYKKLGMDGEHYKMFEKMK